MLITSTIVKTIATIATTTTGRDQILSAVYSCLTKQKHKTVCEEKSPSPLEVLSQEIGKEIESDIKHK